MKFTAATIAVTNLCTLKCKRCSTWQKRDNNILPPEDFTKLPASLKKVFICGGEPFQREDLLEIVEMIKSKASGCRIIIFTPGSLPEIIEKNMEKMQDVGIRVLLYGVREDHDKITGLKGSFSCAVETLKRLRTLNLKDLAVKTSPRQDRKSLSQMRRIAEDFDVDLISSVQPDRDILKSFKKRLEFQRCVVFSYNPCHMDISHRESPLFDLLNYKKTEINPVKYKTGTDSFFMQSNGDIYPCNIIKIKMGNIRENTFEEISLLSEEIQNYVKECPFKFSSNSRVNFKCLKNTFESFIQFLKNRFQYGFFPIYHESLKVKDLSVIPDKKVKESSRADNRINITDLVEER